MIGFLIYCILQNDTVLYTVYEQSILLVRVFCYRDLNEFMRDLMK